MTTVQRKQPIHNEDLLLREIPEFELHQIAMTKDGQVLSTFLLLRDPFHINEFEDYLMGQQTESGIAVLWNDCTLTVIQLVRRAQQPVAAAEEAFVLDFSTSTADMFLRFRIYAKDFAIAETATFLWSQLHHSHQHHSLIRVDCCSKSFCVDTIRPEQWAALFDSNQERHVEISLVGLPATAAIVFATRPYPIHLTLSCFLFKNDRDDDSYSNDAFCTHLENRNTKFGSLFLNEDHNSDLTRLCAHCMHLFDHVDLGFLDDKQLVLQVLAAPLKSLSFGVLFGNIFTDTDLSSASIVAPDVSIEIATTTDACPETFMESFFDQVAQSGHLKKLQWHYEPGTGALPVPASVGNALVRAIAANQELEVLSLGRTIPWAAHMKDLFRVLECHRSMKTFRVNTYPTWVNNDYSWLQRLLQRNRNIEVRENNDALATDGSLIDQIYAVNRGSLSLQREDCSLRPMLVAHTSHDRTLYPPLLLFFRLVEGTHRCLV